MQVMDSKHAVQQETRSGYPKMADFVGLEPQLAIFKRFGSLNAENLLYMQAEIANLEQDLRSIVADDLGKSNDETSRDFASSWRTLQEAGSNSIQWRKRMELRERLKEYNAALLQCVQLQRLDPVHERDLSTLHDWLWFSDDGGLGFLYQDTKKDKAPDTSTKDLYEDRRDLISLADRPGGKDDFTELFTGRILKFFNDKVLYRFRGNSTYDDRTILRIADTIVTILSSLLIVVSIIVLFHIHSTIARLWTVAGFNILFAFVLKVFTNGERIGIFAAAAAFASVQVVFIGTTSGQV